VRCNGGVEYSRHFIEVTVFTLPPLAPISILSYGCFVCVCLWGEGSVALNVDMSSDLSQGVSGLVREGQSTQ
jgi:hypothetical protein